MESPLPAHSLYGEQGRGMGTVDCLHCESIAERSRLHQWEIRAHRHELLFQLFWIEKGACEASIDGHMTRLEGPGLLLLPPAVVHGFRFDPAVEGLVITVQAQHLRRLLSQHAGLEAGVMRAEAHALGLEDAGRICRAVLNLRDEFLSTDRGWRALAIDSALLQLLVICARRLPLEGGRHRQGSRAQEHVQRYQALVEREFRAQPVLSDCAQRLGITGTQLNRVCRQVLGCSALSLLQARLLLEAQRELAYTGMSIKQIAHGLGFADQAYFTRFYQRQTGMSPTAWRLRSATTAAAAVGKQ